MSKYIKLEDMENLIINIAPDGDVFTRGISALQSLPTIDIVHCKDCKYSFHHLNDYVCGHPYGLKIIEPNDYCSNGERSESEE